MRSKLQTPSHVFHRHLLHEPPRVARASGAYLYDTTGKAYLDASGGAAVSCLGHQHPEVLAAMHAQIDSLAYAHTSFFTTDVAEALAEHLIAHAPGSFAKAYFVSGGSEAVEAALKMARQYFVEIGQPQRSRFIARHQSYHGNTLGALAVGGNAWRRRQFAPLLIDVEHVAACYPYRERRSDESDAQYVARLATELDDAFQRLGPDTVLAFVAETVGGATAGVLTPVPGYLAAMKAVCDNHGALFILDEVMCGMGRTGTLHAYEQEAVVPDLLCIAKGLGGGYQPIGAVLAAPKLVDAMREGSGFFQHGHTYLGHPVACAAALAVQQVIERDHLIDAVRERGQQLETRLRDRLEQHPHVGEIRGRGLFWGIELVQNRDSKQPFDPALRLHANIKRCAMQLGLCCYPMGGTVDGRHGDHVLLAPPFICTAEQIDAIVDTVALAIDDALALGRS